MRFGTKGARTRWPTDAIEKYAEDNDGADLRKFKIRDVEREVCLKFPLMGRWSELKETWADLMWLESEAVVSAVILLMRSGVPSLAVHDSLIVPVSAEAMARTFSVTTTAMSAVSLQPWWLIPLIDLPATVIHRPWIRSWVLIIGYPGQVDPGRTIAVGAGATA